MMGEAVLSVSAILTVLVAAVCVLLVVLYRRNLKQVVRILGASVFFMLVCALYPYFHGKTYAVGLTLFEGMCAMLLNSNPAEILAGFDAFQVWYISAYKAVLLVLLIVAPLFTVGITLSFFSEKFTRLIYRIRSETRASYLFSAINERTLSIAEDIAARPQKSLIVFALRVSKEDMDAETVARIKAISAYVVNDDIVTIRHSLRRTRNYYLLDTDSAENLKTGLRLYEKYNGARTDRVNMWIYNKNEMAEVIFDQLYETFNVRLINEASLIAYNLVTDHPLYDAVKEGKLSILLVGAGNIGLEILRALATASCLGEEVKTEIHVAELYADRARAVFEKASPSLARLRNIRFYNADIKTPSFSELLEMIKPTYIVVSLGNETLNMETALEIRRKYGLEGELPLIHALVDHKSIEEEILPNLSLSDWRYDPERGRFESTPVSSFAIKTFGSYEDTYKGLRIGATYRDCLAVAVNAASRGITELSYKNSPAALYDLYNQVSFYKDHSDGFAVSIPYKLYLLGLTLTDDGEGDLSALESRLTEGADRLRRQENQRYEAFMRGKGWTQMTPDEVLDGRLSDKLRKKHARLELTYTAELEKMTGRDFKAEDLCTVQRLPVIIRLANALYGRAYSVRLRK